MKTVLEPFNSSRAMPRYAMHVFAVAAALVFRGRKAFAFDGEQLLEVLVCSPLHYNDSSWHDPHVRTPASHLDSLLKKLDRIQILMTRGTVEVKAKNLIQVRLVMELNGIAPITPHRKLPLNERDDGVMKCVGVQKRVIRCADARSWAGFVGDHTVGSKAEGTEVCQCFVSITERYRAQPVTQAIRFDEEDVWTIENADDAHGGQ